MTGHEFRGLVLGLVDAVECSHMGHPDFRVNGRIFSSLTPDNARANVKLTAEDQSRLVSGLPVVFTPAAGAWGRQGWTSIDLGRADAEMVGEAVTIAWQLARALPPVTPRTRAATAGRALEGAGRAVKTNAVKTNAVTTRGVNRSAVKKGASAGGVADVDAYIAASNPKVRPILERIRDLVRREAPDAVERISYRMPAFFQNGALLYYAPFTHHIGMFPPVKGDAALIGALGKYRGEKGNLRFPLDEPIPYPLIRRIVRARLAEQNARNTPTASKAASSRRQMPARARAGRAAATGRRKNPGGRS